MADISVNEYVRTNNVRGIKKVARINEEATVNRYLFIDGYDHSDTIYGIIRTDQITKHSFNIIDLILVGDYVNGLPVRFVENGRIDIGQEENYLWLKNEHIVSVVTKEQFKSMEYKVGGEDDQQR